MANTRHIREIQSGNDEVIVESAGRYFPAARKFLRMKGIRDMLTPKLFSAAMAIVIAEIRKKRVPEFADFRNLLSNALSQQVALAKSGTEQKPVTVADLQAEVAAQCVSVLDEQSRRLLFYRFAEQKSFEEIATLCNYGNPVIAQFEVEKAYRQFEGIVKVRFNIEVN